MTTYLTKNDFCPVCNGLGSNNVYFPDYNLWRDVECSKCNGKGSIDKSIRYTQLGNGRIVVKDDEKD